jgi:hypothetical protein
VGARGSWAERGRGKKWAARAGPSTGKGRWATRGRSGRGLGCWFGFFSISFPGFDRRLSPDLPRGTVNLIGGELDVNDPRLRTNRTPQSLHHCSVGSHPCHTNDLATKAYPCKRNQEHKQEQEMQSNRLDYEMGSHKPMNGDTV